MIQILFTDGESIEATSVSLRKEGWVLAKVEGMPDTDVRMFPRREVREIRYDQRDDIQLGTDDDHAVY